MKIEQHEPEYEWGASLWFTNLGAGDLFRWYEASYFESPLLRSDARRFRHSPFFLNAEDADRAHAPALDRYAIAYGPLTIDDEDFPSWCDRWSGLLAKASQSSLSQPRELPIQEWMPRPA